MMDVGLGSAPPPQRLSHDEAVTVDRRIGGLVTKLRVLLPSVDFRLVGPREGAAVRAVAAPAGDGTEGIRSESPQKRVLVVDDDPTILEFVQLVLSDESYDVLTAANGAEALAIATRESLALILLDMQMPVMDGPAFMHAYRASGAARAPVVVMTAATNAAARGAEIAADGVLGKPFELSDLLDTVAGFVRGARRAHCLAHG